MSNTIKNGFTKKTIYMIQFTQNSEENNYIMVIADPRIHQEGLHGWQIQQSNNRTYRPDIVFEVKGKIAINTQNIKQTLEVECKQDGGRFIIPFQQYNRVKQELRDPQISSDEDQSDEQESIDQRSDTSEQDSGNSNEQIEARKRGRPKGARNKRKLVEDSFEDQEELNEDQKRGRGRPKGSKNKKGDSKKEEEQRDQLKMLMQGYIKRGKGRPKGSKNKPKRTEQFVEGIPDQGGNQGTNFWKRGKGRPRGSKNKIKNITQDNIAPQTFQQNKQKKNRGRPPGIKNKPNSEPSLSESSQNQNIGEIPQFPLIKILEQDCCNRCLVSQIKRKLIQAKSVEQAREVIQTVGTANLQQNFAPQRRTNLFITALKRNNPYFLQLLLDYKNQSIEYFRCCWDVSGVDQDKFSVRTKKQALSKSGKQKMLGLLHDYTSKTFNIWWKEVTIERIFQSLPTYCNKQIIQILRRSDQNLYYQLYTNVTIAIRSGNYYVASYILQNPPTNIDPQFFTHQHLQFLKNELQLQYKKGNVLKRSMGSNYCCPIHCASINPNGQVLQTLIKNTTNYNISDNLLRKPIHYAAAAEKPVNLDILCRYGADIRDLDKLKMSPLMIACYYGRYQNVRFILDKCNETLYVNHRSQDGYSALHYAVLRGHLKIVQLLLLESSVNVNSQTRDKQSVLHLAAAIGNVQMLTLFLKKGVYVNSSDRFKRTPIMMAVRNHNHQCFKQILKEKPKLMKSDSSGNTLLHYAAAYGNLFILKYLLLFAKQVHNKQKFYPWDVAIGKGHLACAKYLRNQSTVDGEQLVSSQQLQILMLKNVVGSKQGLKVVRSMLSSYPVNYKVLDQNQNSPLHVICSISQQQYSKQRMKQIGNLQIIKRQFKQIFDQLIPILVGKGIQKDRQNKNHETSLIIALQNGNLIAMKELLPITINLGYETKSGVSMINFLAMLASLGASQTKIVLQKLERQNKSTVLKALKGYNDDEPLLNFIKHFTWKIVSNYYEQLQNTHLVHQNSQFSKQARMKAHKKLIQHENSFLKLMSYFESIGADFNVKSKIPYQFGWTVFHYLMQFPSIKILEHFHRFMKQMNQTTNQGMTPLHLFCKINHKSNLVDKQLKNDETGENSLRWLLDNGCDVNVLDKQNSSSIHYAALNKEIVFISILMQYKGKINIINKNNNVPFIELIKMKDEFAIEEFQHLLQLGVDANFSDNNKRGPLHHLVSNSKNFDSSPILCRLLEKYGAQINGFDEHGRTPLFYCFIQIDQNKANIKSKDNILDDETTNDKLQIVQTLINIDKIDLIHTDMYGRTPVHYACEKNFFFSILYLLDKDIDISIQDNQGNTPLAICLISKNLNQAALLLKKGTAFGYVNENGKRMTYFSYALNNSQVQICHLLLDYGYPPEEALKQEVVKDNPVLKKIIIQKCKNKIEFFE